MPTNKLLKNAYNAGELSQYMDGRTDLNKYYNGGSKVINALVLPHGGFTKRPGTIYKATSATRANLIPFEFSVGDALILEWSNLLLRFYKDQTIVYKPYGTEDLSAFDSATGDSSLVAHWLCDDNLATTAVLDDTVAGTHDGVASSNTSTFSVADAESTANSAFDMGNANYFNVADHANLSFGDGTNDKPFSIAIWLHFDSAGGNQKFFSKRQAAANREYEMLVASTGQIQIIFTDNSTTGTFTTTSSTDWTLTDGAWNFVVITYDGTGGTGAGAEILYGVKMYINYSLVTETVSTPGGMGGAAASYTAMEDLAAKVCVGATNEGGTGLWESKIDNVALFNKELTLAEIVTLTGNDSTTAYSITSPYTTAQAFGIHYTQSADVMYIAHEDVHPKKLSRYDDQAWVIEDVPFTGGPFLTENTTETKTVGFARTGGEARNGYYFPENATGTLTASGHTPFNSNIVGALWLVKHTRPDNTTSTQDNDTNAAPTLIAYPKAVRCKGDFTFDISVFVAGTDSAKLWRKAGNGSWQEYRTFTAGTAFSATENEDDVYYAFTLSVNTLKGTFTAKDQINYGVVEITAFTSSSVVVCNVETAVLSNNSSDAAVTTSMWAEGAWSTYRGFPRTVGFHEDRLWWASSTNDPDRKWSSQSGLYEDMSFTDLGADNEAVTAIVKDNEVSQIQWMMSRRVMAIGAANREYSFSAQNPDDPITPLDKKSIPQTGFSSGDIQPVMLNDSIFFLQRQGKKLGAMKFDSVTENFDVDDATLLAYGLLDSAPTNMAVSRSPDSTIWVVRTDGVMPTFTYEPKEEVSGWGRQIFGNSAAAETATGFVESVAVIHGTSEDEIWVNVRRVINSSTVYYTELFAPRSWGTDIEDAKYVDSCVTYDSTATTSMTGGTHLIGETVAIFADGLVQTSKVVDGSGNFTLDTAASVVQYGIPYTMKVRSMRLAVPQATDALQTKIKRVVSTTVRYIRSLLGSAGTEIGGTEYLTDINAVYSTSLADTPENNRATKGGFNEDAYTVIVSDDPVPFTALAAVTEVEV